MKFLKIFLTIIFTTTVLSKKNSKVDWDNFKKCIDKTDKNCKKTIMKAEDVFNQCIDDVINDCNPYTAINSKNMKKECEAWENSKCKKISNISVVDKFPSCKGIPKEYLNGDGNEVFPINLKSIIDIAVVSKNLKCSKDEFGNFCPFALVMASEEDKMKNLLEEEEKDKKDDDEKEKEEQDKEKIYINAINETCKSKSCTDALINGKGIIENYIDDMKSDSLEKRQLYIQPDSNENEKLKQIIEYLNSDLCIAQHAITTNESTEQVLNNRKCIVKKKN